MLLMYAGIIVNVMHLSFSPVFVQRGNQLERIEGLDKLKSLQVLNLSLNRIIALSGLQSLHLLGSINVEKNLVLI